MNTAEAFEQLLHIYSLYTKYKLYQTIRKESKRTNSPSDQDCSDDSDEEVQSAGVKTTFRGIKNMNPKEFFTHTRMTHSTYDRLIKFIGENAARKSIRKPVDFECRLALTLAYLSQGVLPKPVSGKMNLKAMYKMILETCEMLWNVLSPIYVSKPTVTEYVIISKKFATEWDMPHCLGAVDGMHLRIKSPSTTSETKNSHDQKIHTIILMATCDANYTFTDIVIGPYCSQTDGDIFRSSNFGKSILQETLPVPNPSKLPNSKITFPYYFVAENAFPLRTNLMRPYIGRNLTPEKIIFNNRLIRARRLIENTFGILIARWRILNNSLNFNSKNAEKIIRACIALHNFIKLNDTSSTYISEKFVDWEDNDHTLHYGEWRNKLKKFNHCKIGANNASSIAFCLRDQLKDYFCNEGAVVALH